ncbi:neuropeptide Y receptor type 6-like [Clytia hemisphaerica]|uniref:neuropeptide Y receptor type 6-like n=1 Tax=Clytia hemisphaerica TaxID=252671 RepID=UPI0034D399CD
MRERLLSLEQSFILVPLLLMIPPVTPFDIVNEVQPSGNTDIGNLTLQQLCQFILHYNESMCNCQILEEICLIYNYTDHWRSKEKVIYKFEDCDEITQATLVISMSIFGTFGNLLVVIITYHNWKQSSLCHKLIGGLGICDLAFALMDLIQTVPLLWTCSAFYGEIMCKFFAFANNTVAMIGLGFILIVAIERYVGICYPFTRGLSTKAVLLMIIANVLLGVVLNIPLAIIYKVDEFNRCREFWSSRLRAKVYSWLMLMLSFVLPITAIALMYYRIIYTMRRSMKQYRNVSIKDKPTMRRNKEQQRVMFILIAILIAFFLLVAPDKFIWALKDQGFLENLTNQMLNILNLCARIPFSFHVVINPLIYSVIDRKFRESLKNLLSCRDYHRSEPGGKNKRDSVNVTGKDGSMNSDEKDCAV